MQRPKEYVLPAAPYDVKGLSNQLRKRDMLPFAVLEDQVKYIRVLAPVESEAELIEVTMQMLNADLTESPRLS